MPGIYVHVPFCKSKCAYCDFASYPKELSKEQVARLYEIRRQFGLKGKHPANICLNNKKGEFSCHNCESCSCGAGETAADNKAEADLVAEITKKVLAQLGK